MNYQVKVPTNVLDHPRLSSYDKVLWMHALAMQDHGVTIFSLTDLARCTRLSQRAVQRSGKKLSKEGLIRWAKNEWIVTGGVK
jgi:hypothetical protein